jgi:para-nitrobenzyl esterase
MTIIQLPIGTLQGTEQDGILSFIGVPFANPVDRFEYSVLRTNTVTLLGRLQAPQPNSPITAAYENGFPVFREPTLVDDEKNCLNLCIWAPKNLEKKPVMVWVHGGSLRDGSGAHPMYDGFRLAKLGVVVVSINYRMNAFGFLTDVESGKSNFGLRDQLVALDWVQEYIEAFGGDKDNVTAFGESAGAVSIAYHVLNGHGKGRFHRVILQSGVASTMIAHDSIQAPGLVKAAGLLARKMDEDVDVANYQACVELIKQATMEQILQAHRDVEASLPPGSLTWGPAADGVFIKKDSRAQILNEEPLDLSWLKGMILGDTGEEGSWFCEKWGIDTEEKFAGLLSVFVPVKEVAAMVKDMYMKATLEPIGPLANKSHGYRACSAFLGDLIFYYPIHANAEYFKDKTQVSLYRYNWTNATIKSWGLGSFHSAELVNLFGSYLPPHVTLPDDADGKVSRAMHKAWTDFAKTGHAWDKDLVWVIDSETALVPESSLPGKDAQRLQFWEQAARAMLSK